MVFGHRPASVTVLEGLRARLGTEKVSHAPGPEIRRLIPSFFDAFAPGPKPRPQTPEEGEAAFQQAVETARAAELVVAVMGEKADMSGEAASRSSIELPGRQQELLKAVLALGKPVVLVLIGGRPLALEWEAQNVPAILEAWQPGSEGGHAVADVLFGDVNPGGKLPATFPRRTGHAPLYYARTLTHQPEGSPRYQSRYWDGPTTPLYPFSFGLSYTTFAFSNLKLDTPRLKLGQTATVSVDVTTPTVHGLDPQLPPPEVRTVIRRVDASGATEVGGGTGTVSAPATAPGAYLVEVRIKPHQHAPYLRSLGPEYSDAEYVWIYASPFYVR